MSALARMARLVGVEASKSLRGRGLVVGLLATAAVAALGGFVAAPTAYQGGWTVAAKALAAGLWAAEVFVLVAGATAVAGESAQGTLKMILPHAYRRSEWVAAKAAVLVAQAIAFLAVAVGVALLAASLRGGLHDVVRHDDPAFGGRVDLLHPASEMAGHFVDAAAVALASLVATALLALGLSCAFDAVVPPLSTGFLLFLVAKAGGLLGLPAEVAKRVYALYPAELLGSLAKIDDALDSAVWDAVATGAGLRLCAVVAVVSVVAGAVVFSRRDLHA